MTRGEEILPGLWRFTAIHPEWDEDEDWDPEVAWWAVRTPEGVVLIDPLVEDWEGLDGIVEAGGGCAGIVRTIHFHERSIRQARERYGAEVWARTPPPNVPEHSFDRAVAHEEPLPGGLLALDVARDDEIGVWLADQRALVVGDVMLRGADGDLRMCPEPWVARIGGYARLRPALGPLLELEPAHVLVSHGPLVLGDAPGALARAVASDE